MGISHLRRLQVRALCTHCACDAPVERGALPCKTRNVAGVIGEFNVEWPGSVFLFALCPPKWYSPHSALWYMFRSATAFNADIGSWNTARVTNMWQPTPAVARSAAFDTPRCRVHFGLRRRCGRSQLHQQLDVVRRLHPPVLASDSGACAPPKPPDPVVAPKLCFVELSGMVPSGRRCLDWVRAV